MAVTGGSSPAVDVYDEEFHMNLKLAKNLIAQLKNGHDKEICRKWIRRLLALKSIDPVVKKNRNSFFKYLIQTLQKSVQETNVFADFNIKDGPAENEGQFTCRWSADKKTYVAAKPIPGEGILVYLAVAKDVTLGWEHP